MKVFFKLIAIIFMITEEAGLIYGKNHLSVTLEVPKNVASNSSVSFHCLFNYPIQKIGSVKWYRQRAEFFRFSPFEHPPAITFYTCKECHVNLTASNATQVMMQNVSEALSGMFTCEVTIAETFESSTSTGILYVYDGKLLTKPKIKVENRIFNGLEFPTFLCSTVFIKEKNIFSNVFFINSKQIKPDIATYDKKNGYFRLYIDSTPWKNETNVFISCRSILPGTAGLTSDEICYNYVPSNSARFYSFANLISSIFISLLCMHLRFSF